MKIAVLSGKGGAGKTFVSVNLAVASKKCTYIDCDVEEPNGRLFLKPTDLEYEDVNSLLPVFDEEKCDGCRKCIDFCKFNALVFLKGKPMVFTEVCHSCGGCLMVCPNGAVSEIPRNIGKVEKGKHNDINVVTGILNLGEASGVGVIKFAQNEGFKNDGTVIIDCPPGSACSVNESIGRANYCVLVAEPTAFGFHNFKMVYELSQILNKKCGVIINKEDEPYEPLEDFCKENNVEILAKIPYDIKTAEISSKGKIICEENREYLEMFEGILEKIGGAK